MEAAAPEAGTGGVGNGGVDGGRDGTKKTACDVAALRKCLEENKGDRAKCQEHIDIFRSSCSVNPPAPAPPRPPHRS